MEKTSKMNRQLRMYLNILNTEFHGPKDLMRRFEIGLRTLQRDLADFRDAGVMTLKHDKAHENFVVEETQPAFNEKVTGRRREHLVRLRRLTTIIDKIDVTNYYELDEYKSAIENYEYYRDDLMVDDPETFPPDELGDPPKRPDFEDIGGMYKALFPEVTRRTRERDFNELTKAGYPIRYYRKYQVYVCEGAVDYDD